ncbi:hypothetical protein [Streptomyces tirandamycinicus]|uniref:hypothetical protein n=1 Tax=Streptomyces tirandamycinicus TaxID=2174846 RepID=UPI003CC61DC6
MLVSYYGRATSWWQLAPPEGGINGDACLVLDARWDGACDLSSDVSWRVHRSTAWSMLGSFGVPCEVLDARALPTGWTGPGLDDSGWPTATILKARHWGGLGRSRPPVSPYGGSCSPGRSCSAARPYGRRRSWTPESGRSRTGRARIRRPAWCSILRTRVRRSVPVCHCPPRSTATRGSTPFSTSAR